MQWLVRYMTWAEVAGEVTFSALKWWLVWYCGAHRVPRHVTILGLVLEMING